MKKRSLGMAALVVTALCAAPVFAAEPGEFYLYKDMTPAAKARKNPTNPNDPKEISHGRELFEKLCIDCHGRSGNGRGAIAAYIRIKPTDLTDANYMDRRTDAELFWVIKHGSPGTKMPAYGLEDSERWALVDYVRQFSKGRGDNRQ